MSFKTMQTILALPVTFASLAHASRGGTSSGWDQSSLSCACPRLPARPGSPLPPGASPLPARRGAGHRPPPLAVVLKGTGGALGQPPRIVDLGSLDPLGATGRRDSHHHLAHPERSYPSVSLVTCFKVPESRWQHPFLLPEATLPSRW